MPSDSLTPVLLTPQNRPLFDSIRRYIERIEAEYECEGRTITVEIDDVDGEDVRIISDEFPRVFIRHQGWLNQLSMTVNKKHLANIRPVYVAPA